MCSTISTDEFIARSVWNFILSALNLRSCRVVARGLLIIFPASEFMLHGWVHVAVKTHVQQMTKVRRLTANEKELWS